LPWLEMKSSRNFIAAVIGGKLDDVQDFLFFGFLLSNIRAHPYHLQAGYDVNQRDYKKRTPLFIAVEMERLDICQCLIERGGAVINANCGSDCNTALHVAVSQGNEEIVKYLLSKGASKTVKIVVFASKKVCTSILISFSSLSLSPSLSLSLSLFRSRKFIDISADSYFFFLYYSFRNTRVMSTEWLNECIRQEKILPHTK
uniref:BRCT domain-containing protein n=1 Tax=Angiostrongylus cantonensis TaxID=6313 RepID=A0A0K0D1F7_ANGCA